MTATVTNQVTLNLSEELVRRLHSVAEQRRLPFESMIANLLETSLPALESQSEAAPDNETESPTQHPRHILTWAEEGRSSDTPVETLIAQADAMFAQRVEELKGLNPEQLQAGAAAEIMPKNKSRLAKLLRLNKQRSLTAAETQALDHLQKEGEQIALTRAVSLWLLKNKASEK